MENEEEKVKEKEPNSLINKGKVFGFIKNNKIQWLIILIILTLVLVSSSLMRTQNIELLKDITTGKYGLADIDAYYFLRLAETIQQQGSLPQYDLMRKPDLLHPTFSEEILPKVLVLMNKIANNFQKDISIQYISVIYPVIFYALGLIVFFIMIYLLTKSKITALISSLFLAFAPPYLFRSMAGVSDHEPIGMFAFFCLMIFYTLALRNLNKPHKNKEIYKNVGFGVLTGFGTSFTIASWGGIGNFVYMIIPLSFFLFWIIKFRDFDEEKKSGLNNLLIFYLTWIVSSIILMKVFQSSVSGATSRIMGSNGLITLFVLGFIIIDYFLIKLMKKNEKIKKNRLWVAIGLAIIFGFVLLSLLKGGFTSFLQDVWVRLNHPFTLERVGVTVAENQQPHLDDFIAQTGKTFFWLFFGGLIALGVNFAKSINNKKDKWLFMFFWILLICGLLFSRYSESSILNGGNLISKVFYFGSLIVFFMFLLLLVNKGNIKFDYSLLIIFSWMIFMIIGLKGAIRLFFLVTPLICFLAAYLMFSLYGYYKESNGEILKKFFALLLIVVLIASAVTAYQFYKDTNNQAKYVGPSANYQWQKAMAWVRDNTKEEGVFAHWWDYGYWVQYLGERPAIADGGHFEGAFRDHMLGRYLLTNPDPDSALSFLKSNNVSYLLIDPSDIGKYPAYSSIGSDSTGQDRYSWIPVLGVDPRQTQETSNSTIRVYQGGFSIDEDIIYNVNGKDVLLPKDKTALIGIILETSQDGKSLKPPIGVFYYLESQVRIPIRFIYVNGALLDYKEGINATVRVIPSLENVQNQGKIDSFGAVVYLSPKVSSSLVAQLYLMNDPNKKYPGVTLVHSEEDLIVDNIKSQGVNISEFVYYQGLRGPIKIWSINPPQNILVKEEFLRSQGEYAEFDNLTVKK